MGKLTFDYREVRKLVEHATRAPTKIPMYEHVTNPEYWLPGAEPDEKGVVPMDQVDQSKLEAILILAKDKGAYLMSGGYPRLSENDKNKLVHAEGCNPETDEGCGETTTKLFGEDDFAHGLPAQMFIAPGSPIDKVVITLLDDRVEVALMPVRGEAKSRFGTKPSKEEPVAAHATSAAEPETPESE